MKWITAPNPWVLGSLFDIFHCVVVIDLRFHAHTSTMKTEKVELDLLRVIEAEIPEQTINGLVEQFDGSAASS